MGATGMTRNEGSEAKLVEAGTKLGNGIIRAPSSGLGRSLKGLAIGDSEDSFGAGTMAGRFACRTTDAFEPGTFIVSKWTERILTLPCHLLPPEECSG